MKSVKELDMIIPVVMDGDDNTEEEIIAGIKKQNEKFGFKRFILGTPLGRWRSVGYPAESAWKSEAEKFYRIKTALQPLNIECGWLVGTTIKAGRDKRFKPMIKADGSETPFSSCPLDENFAERFSANIANFAKIAEPKFIMFEDDYSITASTFSEGCFCEKHLAAFAERCGKYYTRAELNGIFSEKTAKSLELRKEFRRLSADTLANLAGRVRAELDKSTPEIPLGLWQSGGLNDDGDATESIINAMAGKSHVPAVRVAGSFYNGGNVLEIPTVLFNLLYAKQHLDKATDVYQESDSFPHTRYYISGKRLSAMFAVGVSYGSMGSIYHARGHLDDGNEETCYGAEYKKESKRLNALYNTLNGCKTVGVGVEFDPFYNTVENVRVPLWVKALSRFGVPYTTLESKVLFMDRVQAAYCSDKMIKKALSGGLIVDGDAARILCERGYGEYLGVSVGGDIAEEKNLRYDLLAREVICDKYAEKGKGKRMHAAHILSTVGNGKMLKLTVKNDGCEILSENYDGFGNCISPAMTRFINSLGGRVVVTGLTLDWNYSQALFNYRRQRLFIDLIRWCGGDIPCVHNEPDIFTIVNEPKDGATKDFYGIITLLNLSEDNVDGINLRLPTKWRKKPIKKLDASGKWIAINALATEDGVKIGEKIEYLSPVFLKFEKIQ